jgi:hypothetical protein
MTSFMNIPPSRSLGLSVLALLFVLTACSGQDVNDIAFDGILFKAKTAPVDKKVSRADFIATIYGASASLEGAREAARYEGTKYCVTNYGTSDVDWSVGPDSDPARLTIVDGDISFRGRCDP